MMMIFKLDKTNKKKTINFRTILSHYDPEYLPNPAAQLNEKIVKTRPEKKN